MSESLCILLMIVDFVDFEKIQNKYIYVGHVKNSRNIREFNEFPASSGNRDESRLTSYIRNNFDVP